MNLLHTARGRRALFVILYLSEGAPIGFLWWALPTMLRQAGVPVDSVGALAGALALPWAFKFLWAPLVDVARGPRLSLRGWIVGCQLLMALTLVPLLWLDLQAGFGTLVPLLLLHAVVASTQDAAIDALAVSTVPEAERGSINGWMQAGMLVGRAVLGGGALLLVRRWGEAAVVLLLLAVLLLTLAVSPLYRPVAAAPRGAAADGARQEFARLLRQALKRRVTWLGLAFAALAGAGFEATGALAGPFLVDAGFSRDAVGTFFLFPVVAAMLAGALLGGRAADRWERRRVVATFQLVVAISVVTLAAVGAIPGRTPGWAVWTLLTAVYVAIGLFTASSYALFMDLTEPRLAATQFSAFMGATNLCEAWAAVVAGRVAAAGGYPAAFAAAALVSLFALPLLPGMRRGRRP